MSFSLTDPELEENLNDIDEFIQSKLELACLAAEGPLKETEENAFNCFLPTRGILNGSPPWNKPRQDKIRLENVDAKMVTCPELSNKVPEIVIEVQIMDLKDVYNKKVKKTLEGLEYPLEDSKVTVVVQASEEITSVRAYTQRCPEAAIRTHDTTGPVEVHVNTLQTDARRRVVEVDLGSVYKTEDGHPVYWLEKADVMQRNKWQLVIAVEFTSGLTGNVTSRPFRVTTKAGYKTKSKGLVTGSCKIQQLVCKISGSNVYSATNLDDCRKHKILPRAQKELPDDGKVFKEGFNKTFSLIAEEDFANQHLPAENSSYLKPSFTPDDRILFQPNTMLDRHAVTTYYSRDQRIHFAIERPELPGLLKLVTKQSELVSPRRKANGHKSTDEVFSWACGLCFFERRKKSTIKDHVIHRVCQKPIENKKSGKLGRRQLQRHFSCDFEKERIGICFLERVPLLR